MKAFNAAFGVALVILVQTLGARGQARVHYMHWPPVVFTPAGGIGSVGPAPLNVEVCGLPQTIAAAGTYALQGLVYFGIPPIGANQVHLMLKVLPAGSTSPPTAGAFTGCFATAKSPFATFIGNVPGTCFTIFNMAAGDDVYACVLFRP